MANDGGDQGEYLMIGGSNKACLLYTKDGVKLGKHTTIYISFIPVFLYPCFSLNTANSIQVFFSSCNPAHLI